MRWHLVFFIMCRGIMKRRNTKSAEEIAVENKPLKLTKLRKDYNLRKEYNKEIYARYECGWEPYWR